MSVRNGQVAIASHANVAVTNRRFTPLVVEMRITTAEFCSYYEQFISITNNFANTVNNFVSTFGPLKWCW